MHRHPPPHETKPQTNQQHPQKQTQTIYPSNPNNLLHLQQTSQQKPQNPTPHEPRNRRNNPRQPRRQPLRPPQLQACTSLLQPNQKQPHTHPRPQKNIRKKQPKKQTTTTNNQPLTQATHPHPPHTATHKGIRANISPQHQLITSQPLEGRLQAIQRHTKGARSCSV